MRKTLLVTLTLLVLAGGAAVTAHAPRSAEPADLTPPSAPPPAPPAGFDSLLLREVLNCNQFPNPRCNPNTDPTCFCDDACEPTLDPDCVICEDKCSGPRIDPVG